MNKNRIITYFFILVLFYFQIHGVYLSLKAQIYPDDLNIKINNKIIDWKKLYPFSTQLSKDVDILTSLDNKNNKIKDKLRYVGNYFSAHIPYRIKICEIQMAFEKILGKNLFIEFDRLVVLNNGYLDFVKKKYDYSHAVNNTFKLFDFLNNLKIDFVFAVYPSKNSKFDNQLPKGLTDNVNIMCDEFINILNNKKIKTLDLRENVKNEYKSQYDMFFKTDHHWKPSAGLWAAKEISSYLNNELKWKINTSLFERSKFSITTIANLFLGSQGKKITLAYTKPDDFEIIEPLYLTDFKRFCPQLENAKGSFKDVMINKQYIKRNFYKVSPYNYYLNDEMAYLRFINNSDYAYNKKVLLIKDSFNLVVAPFFALGIKDLTLLDIRYFTGSVRTFIEKGKYDLVLVAYNASVAPSRSDLYNFD